MHELDQSGELRGTAEQLARTARCSSAELAQALTDLQATGAADVTERNGTYCVRNRRMYAEHGRRKSNADRQKAFRGKKRNGGVTPPSRPIDRGHISQPTPNPAPSSGADELEEPLPEDWAGVVVELVLEGVGLAEIAVRSARARGALAREALEVIRQWRELKPLFGQGMLKSKIENLQPDAKICWPGNPKVSNPEAAAELERSQRKTAEMAKSAAQERADNRRARDARAEKYGPILDAMSQETRAELVAQQGVGSAPEKMQRELLLVALEKAS